jgi:serine/threonine protein kinase
MGALPCSERRGIDVVLDIIKHDATYEPEPHAYYEPAFIHSMTKNLAPAGSNDLHALEVAQMIADDRNTRGYESSATIPDLFEVKEPGMQDPPNITLAVHRTTGMVRRLHTVNKPCGAERQERLRAVIRQLQGLRCDSVSRILEVFEDCRTVSLVMEHCSGGTVYDRILQRQYFAEQESAVLIRHILQSLAPLHRNGLAHGQPTPDSFRFHSETPHAALKLVDFGLELKVHMWDAGDVPNDGTMPERRRTACLQFFETCRIVFSAPEVVRPFQARSKKGRIEHEQVSSPNGQFDVDLLSEVIDAHLENTEERDARKLEYADTWSVGAITFLLLCGYPPFFAPCRHAILARIDKTDYSFDPPFWSKISEEAKDFVQQCLRSDAAERMSITEALQHPWIQSLADTSPSGSMLSSFALNLRRFYRTSLIEAFAANCLASKLTLSEMHDLFLRCRETDVGGSGFFTATDLRQVLSGLGHAEIAEAIGMCFSRTLRHPGESYIDYVALVDSIRVRRERLLEEELWRCFRQFSEPSENSDPADGASDGRLPASRVEEFLQVPDLQEALSRDGVQDCERFATDVQQAIRLGSENVAGSPEVDFIDVVSELIRQLPLWPIQPTAKEVMP